MPDEATLLWWGTGLSVVTLIATAVGVPWAVGRLPADYFRNPRRTLWRDEENRPLLGPVVRIGKNVLGGVVVLLGVIMLVAPGQGVLTILIGAMLINFPGKYRLERWLVRRPGVLRTLNWIRRRRDQQPFAEPPAARP